MPNFVGGDGKHECWGCRDEDEDDLDFQEYRRRLARMIPGVLPTSTLSLIERDTRPTLRTSNNRTEAKKEKNMSNDKKKYNDKMTIVLSNVRIMTEPRPVKGVEGAVSACIATRTFSLPDENSKLIQFMAKGKAAEWLQEAGKGARVNLTFTGPGFRMTAGADGKSYYQLDYLASLDVIRQPAAIEAEEDAPPPPPAPARKRRFDNAGE